MGAYPTHSPPVQTGASPCCSSRSGCGRRAQVLRGPAQVVGVGNMYSEGLSLLMLPLESIFIPQAAPVTNLPTRLFWHSARVSVDPNKHPRTGSSGRRGQHVLRGFIVAYASTRKYFYPTSCAGNKFANLWGRLFVIPCRTPLVMADTPSEGLQPLCRTPAVVRGGPQWPGRVRDP